MSSGASPTFTAGAELVTLAHGPLSVEIALRPFAVTVRCAGRRLLRGAGAWVAEGTAHDHFIHLTEGVIANEALAPFERAVRAAVLAPGAPSANGAPGGSVIDEGLTDGVMLAIRFEGGREGRLAIRVPSGRRISFELSVSGEPLRLALDWDRRSDERFVGLGVRHCTQFEQSGRTVQLGADRRYTGPDCPPEMLAAGGIPQGDCAPLPWLQSSRGYGALALSESNGMRFDLSGDRTSVSTRAAAGPLVLELLCDPTPAGRLRSLCRATGFPMLLPEWGYGFWKSRDFHEHADDVIDDLEGFRRCGIALDAIVIDSPWATQYNSWEVNPWQFPDASGMFRRLREDGVRTVLWCTPWVNLDSSDGQIPPQPESERSHHEPSPNYSEGALAGHFVRGADGKPWVGRWWMGTGSLVDLTSSAAEEWWRSQVKRVLELGVEGIKMDDGEGYYVPDDVRLSDGTAGVARAWGLGGLHRLSLQRALDEVWPGRGVLFGRSGWIGQHATGITWAADQASDFWSLNVLVVATLAAACSGFSNWSHDVGGYLGHRLVERCPPELLIRWLQFGCFTPLMQAHGRMPQEPWRYGDDVVGLYRAYVSLHEQLVPYVRAAASVAARTGLPIVRPLCLVDPSDPRGWTIGDAYGYGPSLWVAPVLDDGTREREAPLPHGDWIETWSGRAVRGGGEVVAPAPLSTIPVWVRRGSLIVTYPASHVARGLGDVPESSRPLLATLWGRPACGRVTVRLADGTRVRWSEVAGLSVSDPSREVELRRLDM